MKVFYLALIGVLISSITLGCTVPVDTQNKLPNEVLTKGQDGDAHFSVIRIGKCQYIVNTTTIESYRFAITHKGDCDNPIHIYKKLSKNE